MRTLAKIFASGFGTGYSPVAPGTAGSILAVVIVYLLYFIFNISGPILLAILIVSSVLGTIVGIACCNLLAEEWGKDPSKVVLDEMVGIFISVLWIPISWQTLLASFILFRIFDIWKPFGVSHAEDLKGGIGVMADDIVAGIYANVVLQILLLLQIL